MITLVFVESAGKPESSSDEFRPDLKTQAAIPSNLKYKRAGNRRNPTNSTVTANSETFRTEMGE